MPALTSLAACTVFGAGVARADDASAWRGACEAKIASGPRKEAILACSEALERDRSGASVRALVNALVSGSPPPTSAEVYEALSLAAKEHDNPLGQTTAAAATCAIAESLGDGPMLQHCANDLERLAPNDSATKRARDAIDAQCPPWKFWSAWTVALAAIVLTLVDALRRAPRRASKRAIAASFAATMAFVGASSLLSTARADEPPAHKSVGKWAVDLEHPELGILSEKDRNAEPLEFGYWLQEVALKGEQASKNGDHAAAARLYAALGLAVPDRAVAFVKLCQEYETLGDLPKAINACGDALLRDGARVSDYGRFVHLMLAKPGPLAPKDVAALGAVLAHLREDPAGRDVVDDLECQVGARTSNVDQLRECTTAMSARAPDDAKTLSYQWAFAVAQNRFDDARKIGERARGAGVAPESVAAMERATTSSENRRRWQMTLAATALALALGAVGIVAGRLARRRTSTRSSPQIPEPATPA